MAVSVLSPIGAATLAGSGTGYAPLAVAYSNGGNLYPGASLHPSATVWPSAGEPSMVNTIGAAGLPDSIARASLTDATANVVLQTIT